MIPRTDSVALEAACRAGLGESPPDVKPDEAGARRLLGWIVERIGRARWTREDLVAGYCQRTPREVLVQGEVPFTAPCADLSGVAALLLARAGVPVTLVLGGVVRALRPVKFQTGLELELEGETWVTGFSVSKSSFYRGRFEPTKRRPWVFRRRPDALELDRPFLAYFDEEGREGIKRVVPGYELGKDVRDHLLRSGLLAFHIYRRRARGAPPPYALETAARWVAA